MRFLVILSFIVAKTIRAQEEYALSNFGLSEEVLDADMESFMPEVRHRRQATGGYRLAEYVTYFITAPKKIHPNMVVQMSVSIVNMNLYEKLNVRAVIRREDEEVISGVHPFYRGGTTLMQLQVPHNAREGNYTLRVEGTANGGIGGYLFENETQLLFDQKQVSVFVTLNKPLFRQGQKVLFRVMPVERNLMSRSGSLDIYITDATGFVVRRWLSTQTNAGGVLDLSFQLSDQPAYGTWHIRVNAFGDLYEKPFEVVEYFYKAIDVNVSAPIYVFANEYGIAGVVYANLTQGQPARGTCKIRAEIRLPLKQRDPNTDYSWPFVERETTYCHGLTDFHFTLRELQTASGESIADKEVVIMASVRDWFRMQTFTGEATTVVHSTEVDVHVVGDPVRTFKPNATLTIYFAVAHKDGRPLSRMRRQVTIQRTVRSVTGRTVSYDNLKFLVSDDGMARYTFKAEEDGQYMQIWCYYDIEESRKAEVTLWRHYSPTNTYLYISTSTPSPLVDTYMVFTITTSMFVEQINYIVTSGGNIIHNTILEMSTRQKTFSIAVSRDMIPEAHLIAWYFYKDEVVSDALNFFINGTRLNDVDLRLNRGKDFTGDTIEFNTYGDPSSFIGTQASDYQLWAYGWKPFITETDMIRELRTFEPHVNRSFSWLWKTDEEQDYTVHFPSPTYAVDANQTFDYAGLIIFTDANVTRIHHPCNETLGDHPCMDGGRCYHWTQRCDGQRHCEDGQDEMGCDYNYNMSQPFTPPKYRMGLTRRHFQTDVDWAWDGHFIMPYGRLDLPVAVPDEPMAWVVSAFGISRDLGFGIKHRPARHQGTRAFFMRVEGPQTAVKGEQLGIRLSLFNNWYQDIEVLVMLRESPDYEFVVVEEYGIVRSYNPRTLKGTVQSMVFLKMDSVIEMHFPVLPTILPEKQRCVNITISAVAVIYEDRDTIEYDGVTNYLHTPYFIDLVNSGSQVLHDLEIPVPERFIRPNERQHLYVPGSPEAGVGIVGDVVGPGFFEDYLDTENTLRKPYGGAEHNLYNFGTNLLYLKYLKATNQLQQDVLNRGLDNLNIALQRQLSYMNRSDGSFSMFRDYREPTPSVWLQSFTLRMLNEANEKDWELSFFIQVEMLNEAMVWLCAQQLSNGAFQEASPVYDRKFVQNGTNSSSLVSLTAHVLISMQESTRVTGAAEICRNSAMASAARFLELALNNVTDVYETAIITYALHVVGSAQASHAFNLLLQRQRSDNLLYWANKKVPANEVVQRDTIQYYQPRRWWDNEGYAVESTSYALLTYLRRNMFMQSEPIMKWLNTMRNTFGGMASTQDSIMALKALTEYAKLDTNRALYNIRVIVSATARGNYSEEIDLNRSNWQKQQLVNVAPVWGSVRGRALGTGVALMQLTTKVNVEYPRQIRPVAEGVFFDLTLPQLHFHGKNFSILDVTACARWMRPDLSERSGLSVMEIHAPTGYVVTNDVLRTYAQSGKVPTLHRAEMIGRKVVFYFDYLLRDNVTCVKWRMDRWYPAANMTIQHKIRVFDYYEPGMHNTTLYTTYQLFNLHICQVCGSFQCPYCPFYNVATSVSCFGVLPLLFLVFLTVYLVSEKT